MYCGTQQSVEQNLKKKTIQCLEFSSLKTKFAYPKRFNNRLTNFMVTPCINNSQHFIFQVMHITIKKT